MYNFLSGKENEDTFQFFDNYTPLEEFTITKIAADTGQSVEGLLAISGNEDLASRRIKAENGADIYLIKEGDTITTTPTDNDFDYVPIKYQVDEQGRIVMDAGGKPKLHDPSTAYATYVDSHPETGVWDFIDNVGGKISDWLSEFGLGVSYFVDNAVANFLSAPNFTPPAPDAGKTAFDMLKEQVHGTMGEVLVEQIYSQTKLEQRFEDLFGMQPEDVREGININLGGNTNIGSAGLYGTDRGFNWENSPSNHTLKNPIIYNFLPVLIHANDNADSLTKIEKQTMLAA